MKEHYCLCDNCCRLRSGSVHDHEPQEGIGGLVALLLILIALFVMLGNAGCASQPAKIYIKPGIPNPSYAAAEIREGIEYFCQERNRDCEEFQRGLKITVYSEPFAPGLAGLYWPLTREIQLVWLNGVSYNALLHELLHHQLWLRGEGYMDFPGGQPVGQHTTKFLTIVQKLRDGWIEFHEPAEWHL